MSYKEYTDRPKSGMARLAWDKFVMDKKERPESVQYVPNYDHQFKGWICYFYVPDPQLKHANYSGASHYVFYHSAELFEQKERIENTPYVDPPKHKPFVEILPTAEEIELHQRLMKAFTDYRRTAYKSGISTAQSTQDFLEQFGVTTITEYLENHNCFIIENNSPHVRGYKYTGRRPHERKE